MSCGKMKNGIGQIQKPKAETYFPLQKDCFSTPLPGPGVLDGVNIIVHCVKILGQLWSLVLG